MDKLSVDRISKLHPDIRSNALDVLSECECVLKGSSTVRFTYTLRTFKEQQDLYNLGRTIVNPDGKSKGKPMGNIVTNAKAGQSIHNYGLAIDIALIIDGKTASWNTIKDFDGDGISDWMECVKIFKKHGWEWGGDWRSFPDAPHFQFDYGYSWQQLQAKFNSGDLIPGTQYVNLSRIIPQNMLRTTASVNFRTAGTVSSKVIMVILKGELVTEIERKGEWSLVDYNGKRGYVSNKYLTK